MPLLFRGGLIHTLRPVPEVVRVQEMLDTATVEMALRAAETRHVVFTTAHAPGAPLSVARLVDLFPSQLQSLIQAQLAATLEGVKHQQLLPRATGVGRVPAIEVMLGNYAAKNLASESTGTSCTAPCKRPGAKGCKPWTKTGSTPQGGGHHRGRCLDSFPESGRV